MRKRKAPNLPRTIATTALALSLALASPAVLPEIPGNAVVTEAKERSVIPQKSKYGFYVGRWVADTHGYVTIMQIKKLTKKRIKGEIYTDHSASMGSKDHVKFNKKIKLKNGKASFNVKTAKGYRVKVTLKLGKPTYSSKFDAYCFRGLKMKSSEGIMDTYGYYLNLIHD